jgi:hypothetical protein
MNTKLHGWGNVAPALAGCLAVAALAPDEAAAQTWTIGPQTVLPMEVGAGTTSGREHARRWARWCTGQVTEEPTLRLQVEEGAPTFYLTVSSPGDSTLLVTGPDDVVACDDDGMGMNASLLMVVNPGIYEVRVGSFTGEPLPWTLTASTEVEGGMMPSMEESADPLPPADGPVQALSAAFEPHPMQLQGTAGGPFSGTAQTTEMYCNGWLPAQPQHRILLGEDLPFLRMSATSPRDTTLFVRGPGGQIWCNDDTHGVDPEISGPMGAGTYDIYVGTWRQNTSEGYTLTLARTPMEDGMAGAPGDIVPDNMSGLADLAAGGGEVSSLRMAPGFLPDPRRVTGQSGGSTQGNRFGRSTIGPCRGTIPEAPQHELELDGDFSWLRLTVDAASDTTLVVVGPAGQVYCHDDVVGLNPEVATAFPAGRWQVYVGSIGPAGPYTLEVSELSR